MALQESIEAGLLLVVMLFTGLFLLNADLIARGSAGAVKNVDMVTRFIDAAVMTIAPTSEIAIAIDVGAAFISSIGLMQSVKESVKSGVVIAAFLYFFTSLLVNYAAAPV